MANNNKITYTINLGTIGADKITYVKESLKELGKTIGTIPGEADKARNAFVKWGAISSTFSGLKAGMENIANLAHQLTEAYGVQEEAELKLETVMRQRMGATDDMVESIRRLASEQQAQGVIGDEVQLAGAQQVATFLNEKSSIEKLLPAMNNLAVQRKGLNVTSEDMVNIGNLVGKVMQGNVGALTRVGITFTEAQKKMLKYGDESQRAAMLAQVITDNVGNMNAELAKTDAGKAKQMANDFGDMQERLGKFLSRYETTLQVFSQISIIAVGIGQLATGLATLAKTLGITTLATKGLNAAWAWSERNIPILRLAVVEYAAAEQLAGKSAMAAAASTTLFKNAVRGLMIATGIGAALVALSVAFDAVSAKSSQASTSIGSANNGMKSTADVAAEAREQIASQVGAYQQAIIKTENFKGSKQDENKIVKDLNNTYGDTLGTYETVADWYKVLTTNSQAYTDQLYAQAKMQILVNKAAKNKLDMDELERQHPDLKGAKVTVGGKEQTISTTLHIDSKSDRPAQDLAAGDNLKHLSYQRDEQTGQGTLVDYRSVYQSKAKADEELNDAIAQVQKEEAEAAKKIVKGVPRRGKGGGGGNRNNVSTNKRVDKGSENLPILPTTLENIPRVTDRQSVAGGLLDSLNDQLQRAQAAVGQAPTIELAVKAQATADDLQRQIDNITKGQLSIPAEVEPTRIEKGSAEDKLQSRQNAEQRAQRLEQMVNLKIIGKDDAEKQIADINAKLKELGMEPIKLTFDKTDAEKQIDDMATALNNVRQQLGGDFSQSITQWQEIGEAFDKGGDAATGAGGALAAVGQQLQQVGGDGAAAKTGAVMASIGQLILGFATASAEAGKLGPWGWIGFTLAGLAQLTTLIATISSFSTGGVVPGSSYSGDNVLARVNSGEMILNARQQARLFALADGRAWQPTVSAGGYSAPVVMVNTTGTQGNGVADVIKIDLKGKGRTLYGVMANDKALGKKIGRKFDI